MSLLESSHGVKSLPLSELVVVGVICCVGNSPGDGMEFELEVLRSDVREGAQFHGDQDRCACCGQRLKYACEVVHKPTATGYYVGRSCASKIDALRPYIGAIETSSVALAERAACNSREQKFRSTHAADCPALDWAASPTAPAIAKDIIAKLRRFGSLSVKQTSLLERLRASDVARRSSATGSAAAFGEGRTNIGGVVVSMKQETEDGSFGTELNRWTMVVDCGNGVRLRGTCPQALLDAKVAITDRIQFCAVVRPSSHDPLFGFFSRPTKAAIITRAGQCVSPPISE